MKSAPATAFASFRSATSRFATTVELAAQLRRRKDETLTPKNPALSRYLNKRITNRCALDHTTSSHCRSDN